MKREFPNAVVKRWIDGDTVDLDVDLGFKVWSGQRFRLAGINTPEKGEVGCQEATDFANSLAPAGTSVSVVCHGLDRYGRWVADVKKGETNVGVSLLAKGLAKEY